MRIDTIFKIGDKVCFIVGNQLKQGEITTIETYTQIEDCDVATSIQYGVYYAEDNKFIALEQENLAFIPISEIKE